MQNTIGLMKGLKTLNVFLTYRDDRECFRLQIWTAVGAG